MISGAYTTLLGHESLFVRITFFTELYLLTLGLMSIPVHVQAGKIVDSTRERTIAKNYFPLPSSNPPEQLRSG